MIANTTTEMAHDKEIQSSLIASNQHMKSIILDYLADGRLSERADVIADSILIYTTGVAVLSKYIKDPKRFEASLDQFIQSIEN